MASKYYSLVTDVGTQQMLEAVNNDRKVNIVEFAVGDGNGAFYKPTTEQTTLRNEVWRGSVNSCYISEASENLLIIESVIPSNVGGFTIREMAVFDDKGNMIAVCNTPDTQKVKVSDGVVHELDLSIEIALVNTDSVELVVDPNVVSATKKDVKELEERLKLQITAVNQMVSDEWQEALKIIEQQSKTTDGIKSNVLDLALVVSALAGAKAIDADNIALETFDNDNDIIIVHGKLNPSEKMVYA